MGGDPGRRAWSGAVSGGYVYACAAFAPALQAQDGSDLPGSAVVCAATFVSGQPYVF